MQSLKDTLDKWASDNGIDPAKVLISKATMVFPFEFPDNLEMMEIGRASCRERVYWPV